MMHIYSNHNSVVFTVYSLFGDCTKLLGGRGNSEKGEGYVFCLFAEGRVVKFF